MLCRSTFFVFLFFCMQYFLFLLSLLLWIVMYSLWRALPHREMRWNFPFEDSLNKNWERFGIKVIFFAHFPTFSLFHFHSFRFVLCRTQSHTLHHNGQHISFKSLFSSFDFISLPLHLQRQKPNEHALATTIFGLFGVDVKEIFRFIYTSRFVFFFIYSPLSFATVFVSFFALFTTECDFKMRNTEPNIICSEQEIFISSACECARAGSALPSACFGTIFTPAIAIRWWWMLFEIHLFAALSLFSIHSFSLAHILFRAIYSISVFPGPCSMYNVYKTVLAGMC